MTPNHPKLTQDLSPIILDSETFAGFDPSSIDMGLHLIAESILNNMQKHAKHYQLSFELAVYCKRLTVSYLTPNTTDTRNIRMDLPTLVLFSICTINKTERPSALGLREAASTFFTHLNQGYRPLSENLRYAENVLQMSPLANYLDQLALTASKGARREHRLLRKQLNAEITLVRQTILTPRVI